jgi:hypothetical protein
VKLVFITFERIASLRATMLMNPASAVD